MSQSTPTSSSGVAIAAAVALAVLAAAAVVACGGQSSDGGSTVSCGDVIFQNGEDANGASIPRTVSQNGGGMMGGATSGGGMMGGGMMGGGCADCHGRDAHGRSTASFTAPDVTYANLTDPKGMLMPDGTRGPTYADAGIQKAVTQGLDPEGSRLEWPMPQWQLSGAQWGDLLAYLKTPN